MNWFLLLIPPLVRNADDIVCSHCKYFNKVITYRDIEGGDHDYDGICTRFGEKNIVTGQIEYQLAMVRREQSNLCKIKGLFFLPSSECNKDCTL